MFAVRFAQLKHLAMYDDIGGDETPTEHGICSKRKINLLFINKTH